MEFSFQDLEQRAGKNTVPVELSNEERTTAAENVALAAGRVRIAKAAKKEADAGYNEEIKSAEERLDSVLSIWRDRKRPQEVEGLWGYDFDALIHPIVTKTAGDGDTLATPRCSRCEVDAEPDEEGVGMCPNRPDPEKFPLGQKWFVLPTTGKVYGPVAITENDRQRPIDAPALAEVKKFPLRIVTGKKGPRAVGDPCVCDDGSFDGEPCTRCDGTGYLPLNETDLMQRLEAAAAEDAKENEGEFFAGEEGETDGEPDGVQIAGFEPEDFDGGEDLEEVEFDCAVCFESTFEQDAQTIEINGNENRVCPACAAQIKTGEPAPVE